MRKLLARLFGLSKTTLPRENLDRYVMSVTEIPMVGDKYTYLVKAKDHEEALVKLMIYFYSADSRLPKDDVILQHRTVTLGGDYFRVQGMYQWMGRVISGRGTDEDVIKMKEFCKKHNIKTRYDDDTNQDH